MKLCQCLPFGDYCIACLWDTNLHEGRNHSCHGNWCVFHASNGTLEQNWHSENLFIFSWIKKIFLCFELSVNLFWILKSKILAHKALHDLPLSFLSLHTWPYLGHSEILILLIFLNHHALCYCHRTTLAALLLLLVEKSCDLWKNKLELVEPDLVVCSQTLKTVV